MARLEVLVEALSRASDLHGQAAQLKVDVSNIARHPHWTTRVEKDVGMARARLARIAQESLEILQRLNRYEDGLRSLTRDDFEKVALLTKSDATPRSTP